MIDYSFKIPLYGTIVRIEIAGMLRLDSLLV